MMKLHYDAELFLNLIENTAGYFQMPDQFIEKDYYISIILEEIKNRFPSTVFKGGTSLSKCYKVIHRFSEDIDLGFNNNKRRLTNSEKRQLKQVIIAIIEQLKFELMNRDSIYTRRDFNRYEIGYSNAESSEEHLIRDHLLVETYLFNEPFPYEEREFSSYISEYLKSIDRNDLIDKYGLYPFAINAQTLERTFVDKVFAVCDYYEKGLMDRNSRHLYDLHQIWLSNYLDITSLYSLFQEVSIERRKLKNHPSSDIGYQLKDKFQQIIENDVFKFDYESITMNLFYKGKELDYEKMHSNLKPIVESEIIPDKITSN